MTRRNRRNCLVTVRRERAQNKLRHMDLRWKRAGNRKKKEYAKGGGGKESER